MTSRIMRAMSTVWVANPNGGAPRLITAGDLLAEDDPFVQAAPGVFRAVNELVTVEQATAAPGEKRTRAPKK